MIDALQVQQPVASGDNSDPYPFPEFAVTIQIKVWKRRLKPVEPQVLKLKRDTQSRPTIVTIFRVEHESDFTVAMLPPNHPQHLQIAVWLTPCMELDSPKSPFPQLGHEVHVFSWTLQHWSTGVSRNAISPATN